MVRFLTALDGSAPKRLFDAKTFDLMLERPSPARPHKDGSYSGRGFFIVARKDEKITCKQEGLWHGARTVIKRSPNGVNGALAFNTTMQPDMFDAQAIQETIREVRERIEELDQIPDIDLFREFR